MSRITGKGEIVNKGNMEAQLAGRNLTAIGGIIEQCKLLTKPG